MSITSTKTTEAPTGKRPLPAGRRLSDGHYIYWWIEFLAIFAFYGIYSFIRNENQGGKDAAFHHAKQLIQWQHQLGIYHEQTLQSWALHFKPLIVSMNYFYGSLHFVVTAGVGIYLFRKWSDDYPLWRNAIGIATATALIGFVLWPLMPPRLLDSYLGFHHYGFQDTLAKYPAFWSFNSGAISKISNQYAAMPSVHCAWALWCACALIPRLKHNWAKVLAVLYPIGTVTAIVLTGNHYVLDAVGGFIIMGIGYFVSRRFTRAGRGVALPG